MWIGPADRLLSLRSCSSPADRRDRLLHRERAGGGR
jgi:hypothetical protein